MWERRRPSTYRTRRSLIRLTANFYLPASSRSSIAFFPVLRQGFGTEIARRWGTFCSRAFRFPSISTWRAPMFSAPFMRYRKARYDMMRLCLENDRRIFSGRHGSGQGNGVARPRSVSKSYTRDLRNILQVRQGGVPFQSGEGLERQVPRSPLHIGRVQRRANRGLFSRLICFCGEEISARWHPASYR